MDHRGTVGLDARCAHRIGRTRPRRSPSDVAGLDRPGRRPHSTGSMGHGCSGTTTVSGPAVWIPTCSQASRHWILCRNPAAVVAGRVALRRQKTGRAPCVAGPAMRTSRPALNSRSARRDRDRGRTRRDGPHGDGRPRCGPTRLLVCLGVIALDEGIEVKDLLDELRAAGNADPADRASRPLRRGTSWIPTNDPRGDPTQDATPVDPVRFLASRGSRDVRASMARLNA